MASYWDEDYQCHIKIYEPTEEAEIEDLDIETQRLIWLEECRD